MAKSLMVFGGIFAALTVAMSAALAAPQRMDASHELNLSSGQWDIVADIRQGSMVKHNSKQFCVDESRKTISLAKVVDVVSADCEMRDVSRTSSGYAFGLNCRGSLDADLNGHLSLDDSQLSMSSVGANTTSSSPQTVIVSLIGTNIGECAAQ